MEKKTDTRFENNIPDNIVPEEYANIKHFKR